MRKHGGGGKSGRDPSIGILSPCGWGNLGDAAIQDAAIASIRRRVPTVDVCGFTLNPRDTYRRHGIPTYPIHGVSLRNYAVDQDSPLYSAVTGTRRRLERVPVVGGLLDRLVGAVAAVVFEARYVVFAVRKLRRLDMLVVSGGGQFDDYWGGAWGHPYAMLRWTVLARMLGKPVWILSVGFGTVRSRLTGLFFRVILRLSSHCSFRDERSARTAAELTGATLPLIVPDLAFGTRPLVESSEPAETDRRLEVAVSPIAYLDPRSWPVKDGVAYDRYVRGLTDFVTQLLVQGHRVVLFGTDGPDVRTIGDVRSGIPTDVIEAHGDDLVHAQTPGVTELLDTLRAADVVVASRLHGVLLSHVMEKPVLAISYDWKVDRHMAEMREGAWRIGIDHAELVGLMSTFSGLVAQRERSIANIRSTVAVNRDALARQYDQLASALLRSSGREYDVATERSVHSAAV